MNFQLTMPLNKILYSKVILTSLLFVSAYIKFLGKGPKCFLSCQVAGFLIT